VEPGDGLPPLHLRIHCRIRTDSPGQTWWKHPRCNANITYVLIPPCHICWLMFACDCCLQVMATSPRSDILMNLPALEKLETMLLVKSQFGYLCKFQSSNSLC
jgi:hypothetical protein